MRNLDVVAGLLRFQRGTGLLSVIEIGLFDILVTFWTRICQYLENLSVIELNRVGLVTWQRIFQKRKAFRLVLR